MVIDTHIKTVVQFHNVLHEFCARKGMGTTIMELKLAQELASVEQEPLLLVSHDQRKAYGNLYQGRLLQTLAGYGAGLKIRGLLAKFWSRREVVTFQKGFHGLQL